MEPHLRELKAGQCVAHHRTGIKADLVVHDQGLIIGGVTENDPFPEIIPRSTTPLGFSPLSM